MKKVLILLFLKIGLLSSSQELVVNKSGDTIVLNSDKTWSYKNEKTLDEKITIDDFKETYAADGKTLDMPKNGGLFFRSKDGKMSLSRKIVAEDGAGNKVEVKFSISLTEAQLKELGVENINKINYDALIKTKYTLKNKYTFIPREISWYYSDKPNFKGKWLVSIKYSAQNDLGALKDGANQIFYNIDGTEFKG